MLFDHFQYYQQCSSMEFDTFKPQTLKSSGEHGVFFSSLEDLLNMKNTSPYWLESWDLLKLCLTTFYLAHPQPHLTNMQLYLLQKLITFLEQLCTTVFSKQCIQGTIFICGLMYIRCTSECLCQQHGVCGIHLKYTTVPMFIVMREHVIQCDCVVD